MTTTPIRKIAISTGGGDAPGLNAVIRAAVSSAVRRGWECFGIRDGYNGALMPEQYGAQGIFPLATENVRGIAHLGGTLLGTTNKGNPLRFPITDANGDVREIDRTGDLVQVLRARGIDALISVGGDGSMAIAHVLAQKGLRVVGVPKTIDNDLDKTYVTFGFDTAVSFATECLDRLHSTAESHGRVMVVEVMGRYAGWIALNAGVAGSADAILIPEIPYEITKVAEKIRARDARGRKFSIVVVAEGARPKGGAATVKVGETGGHAERLGGIGERIAQELEALGAREARVVVLGHLLRGGSPTAFDRLSALRFGAAAVRALEEGRTGIMVALNPPSVNYIPLEEVTRRMKTVAPDCDTILTARDLGICLGD